MAMSRINHGKENPICSLCNAPYEYPKVLPCAQGHVYCGPCLESKIGRRSTYQCIECKQIVFLPEGGVEDLEDFNTGNDVDEITRMVHRQDLGSETVRCRNHGIAEDDESEHRAATFRCTTCCENYCDSCKMAHKLFPGGESHRFVSVRQGMDERAREIPPVARRLKRDTFQMMKVNQRDEVQSEEPQTRPWDMRSTFQEISRRQPIQQETRPFQRRPMRDTFQRMEPRQSPGLQVNESEPMTLRLVKTIKGLNDAVADVTEHDRMVVALCRADNQENKVYVYPSTHENRALSDRILEACPCPYRIISLFPFRDELAIIDREEGGIRLISTNHGYSECICIPDTMNETIAALALSSEGQIVYSDDRPPIEIKVVENYSSLKVIYDDSRNDELQSPWYICVNSQGQIIVSDVIEEKVIILEENSRIANVYKSNNVSPDGICVIRNDEILVCDNQKKCVHHLDRKGRFIDYILLGIEPTCVCFKDPILYVGLKTGDINVYQLY